MDHNKVLNYAIIPVNIAFIVFLILEFLNKLGDFWNFVYIFYFFLILNTIYLAFKIKNIPEKEREKSPIIQIFSYMFLLSLVILAINQFLQRDIVNDYLAYIIGLSIALGFLTFYAHQNKVERELEDEKEKEEHEEKKRYDLFPHMFPTLNKIPIIRNIVRWMYKEGWAFSIPFVIIVIAFIALKIAMPIIFTGSYVDEYLHILSGVEFFNSGHFAEFYQGEYYTRGAYVSFIVGLAMLIFGKTIFVAKMVPATIGIINFFLLYAIAKKIITRKPYILLLMFIYLISPWVIFNHFYIRTYVFYEFFLLISTLLFIKILDNIKKNKGILKYFSLFILINIINFFLSNDAGMYMVVIANLIFFTYFSVFVIRKNGRIWNKINNYKLFPVYFLILVVLFFVFDIPTKIDLLLNGTLDFTSPQNLKYDYYFFNLNLIFTILFFLSVATIKSIKNKRNILIITGLIIFIVHLMSSQDLQILRGIIYFFPLYFLISIYVYSKLNINKLISVVLLILIILTCYQNYPTNFFNGPYVPHEVIYVDYEKAYKYVSDSTNGSIIVSDSAGYSGLFHINNEIILLIDQQNNRATSLEERNKIFLDGETNTYKFSLGIPLITYTGNENELKDKYIVVKQTYILLNSDVIKEIEKTHNKIEFKDIIVYSPKQE